MSGKSQSMNDKKRVMHRKNFRQIRRKAERLEELQKKHRTWIEDTCDENNWWPREWSARTGEVKKTAVVDGEVKVVSIERAPQEVTKEARRRMNEIEAADLDLRRVIEKIACSLHVPTDALDAKTGEIMVVSSDEATEVNICDNASSDADEDDQTSDEAPNEKEASSQS
jgi:hypothetical protein